MRGYLRCERCDWSRIYARFSVARLPQFCPACGRRVVRERNPTKDSPTVAHWRAVSEKLTSGQPPQDESRQ
jgi:uncharacterized protein (DUF983 family)